MATQNAQATNQPYFNKASQRPPRSASNTNSAPSNVNVVRMQPRGNTPTRNENYPTTDEIFTNNYENVRSVGASANTNQAPDQTQNSQIQYIEQPEYIQQPQGQIQTAQKKKKAKQKTVVKYASRKARASLANTWITGWSSWWYLGLQVPVAVIGNAALGFAAWMYFELSQWTFAEGLFRLANSALTEGTIAGVINYILKVVIGIDVNPLYLFAIPFVITFGLGLLQLISSWFTYTMMGLKPLSGTAGWLKSLMFLFVMVGYALPILNLFPLIYFWTGAVWTYPK